MSVSSSRSPHGIAVATLAGGLLIAGLNAPAAARDPRVSDAPAPIEGVAADRTFHHLSTFDIVHGNGSQVAEIIDVTTDGAQLVYTDSGSEAIGFVDITDPASPTGAGSIAVGGEPTSLVVQRDVVLVAVNTSADFVDPSGTLLVVDIATRSIVAEHELGGQPDSIALAPDGKRAAVVIENERDEDVDDGLIPQQPTGGLQIIKLSGTPKSWKVRDVDLSAVAAAAHAGADLEPEYVDINDRNLAVVTFQENNHVALVDLKAGKTVSHFPAGSVSLTDVDVVEDDAITLDGELTKRREPDAVAWIDGNSFATANEGDYTDAAGDEGGSRGFTIFNVDGTVEFESAEAFEHLFVSVGHYNEGRSENKGVEPESVEVGVYDGRVLLFVGSERSNAVGVYEIVDGEPAFLQVLPTGIAPEGLKAIPALGLFVASTEEYDEDLLEAGVPTMVNIYRLEEAPASYPGIVSASENGIPIPWVALSGLAGDPVDRDTVHAVSDSFLADGFVYTIDVSTSPAVITRRIRVETDLPLDLEGIAVAPDGNFWLGSEGTDGGEDDEQNRIVEVDPTTGAVLRDVLLPAELTDGRRSNGIEGIAIDGDMVYVAIQRAWPGEGDTDEANTKIGRYDLANEEWTFVHYPLDAEGSGGWVGLSELTLLPDGSFAVVERDKGWGPTTGFNAELKAVYGVDLRDAPFAPYDETQLDGGLTTIPKVFLRDLLPDLAGNSIWTPEKLEGLAVTADGQVFVVTDNDGVDDAPGETVFLDLGHWEATLAG